MESKYYVFKMDLKLLNIVASILIILAIIIVSLLYPDIWNIFGKGKLRFTLWILPLMIGYFVLHELLHALSYVLHGGSWNKITFGAELEKGVFYCLCKQDITRRNILISTLYPLFYIGIVTLFISILFKLPMLGILSITNISGSAGDLMYFVFLKKLDKDIKFSELDDGTSFAILSKKDISGIKSIGLQFVGVYDSIPREDFNKIKVSKLSYAVGLISIILFILGIIIA